MVARFMKDTPYERSEAEMQRPPGYRNRGSGMVVGRYPYSARDLDCAYCLYKGRKKTCGKAGGCIFLAERLAAGCVPTEELLEAFTAEVDELDFSGRMSHLMDEEDGFFFEPEHRERFENRWAGCAPRTDASAMCAALYLLAADRFLWRQAAAAIRTEGIRFYDIHIHGVDLDGYILFYTAKDLYQGTKHISLSELTDPELVSDRTFRLAVGAFLIRRYGVEVLAGERRGGL
ncbi:MAG: hypothetical protein LUC98_05175 [Lachnospiraceae bacterium]|nr:hypothetical protein [Lachnospiraceae bacterium]